jgi:GntR family transcriptional regulator
LISTSIGSETEAGIGSLVGAIVMGAFLEQGWYYDDSIIRMRRVNKNDSVALYDVVAAEIRRAIADGEAGPGERMPRAVDLAAILGVNKNTVIRALHILRDEGLLDFTRGRGVRVVGTPQKSAVLTRIDELLEFARSQGYQRDEIVAMMQIR